MFGNVFNPQNGFWRWFARVCDIVGLSLCWAVLFHGRVVSGSLI